ncbi:sugar phosphate isomerase/epimerase [Methanobacterium movens]
MKIGVSTLALYPQPWEEVINYLEGMQVEYCEIIHEYPYHNLDVDILDSYSLNISVHSPLSDINIASLNPSIQRSSIDQVKKSVEWAYTIGAEVVVAHPGQVPFLARVFQDKILEKNYQALEECASYAQDRGIQICVENMPRMEGYLFKDLGELDNLVNNLGVLMTLDVGHAHTMGFSTDIMLDFDSLGHLHLSDNDGSFDNHQALGQGSIDFDKLLNKLHKNNYQGILTIEVKNKAEIEESLDYLKPRLKKL